MTAVLRHEPILACAGNSDPEHLNEGSMMKTNLSGSFKKELDMPRKFVAVLLAGAFVGCSETATELQSDPPSFAKGGAKGNALILSTFQGRLSVATPDTTVDAFMGTRISANTEGRGKTPGTELCLDLSVVGGQGILDQFHYGEFVNLVADDQTSDGMGEVCTVVTMHTRDHSNEEEGGAAGQLVGAIEHAGGKIVLKDFQTQKKVDWEWRLLWDTKGFLGTSPTGPVGEGVCIDHPSDNTWHVYNDDDVLNDPPSGTCAARGIKVDNVAELWRLIPVGRNQVERIIVAEFVFPFRFTATKQ